MTYRLAEPRPHAPSGRAWARAAAVPLTITALAAIAGCASPLAGRADADLRRSIARSVERELSAARAGSGPRTTAREERVGSLGFSDDRVRELDAMSGFANGSGTLGESDFGPDLLGQPAQIVEVGLGDSIRRAVQSNLAIQAARLSPAISESQVVQAEAAFDWVFFSTLDWRDTDLPIPTQSVGTGVTTASVASDQTVTNITGLRRQLTTGGSFSVAQTTIYTDNRTTTFGSALNPDPGTSIGLTFAASQPLLRGFGSEVALSEVRLAQNTERAAVLSLKNDLIALVTEVEAAYWNLFVTQQTLRIQTRLLERGIEVRDQLRERARLDATQAQVADAVARVERRRADLIRTRNALRQASDAFKAIINDPDLPVGSELIALAAQAPIDQPIDYSLADAIASAVENRPEIDQAVLSIDNASIRQIVAERGRLPRLDVRAELTLASLDDELGNAYGDLIDNEFIDSFLFGLDFEQEIGNRAGEARSRQRRLERMQAVVAYRGAVQQVVLGVKNALNDIIANYALIEQSRTSRLAAAEVLRALLIEKNLTRGYTVERLDLELNRQEQLAAQEIAEAQAIASYNTAIAELHRATGTALERSRIDFVVPDADQIRRGEAATDYNDAQLDPDTRAR